MARPGSKPAPVACCSSSVAEIDDSDRGDAHPVAVHGRATESSVLLRPDTAADGREPIEPRASDGGVRIAAALVEVLSR